jgi:predicted dehydrogenase
MTEKTAGPRPRVAIVGGGFMAQVHSRAARNARAELAGIVSSSPQRWGGGGGAHRTPQADL